MKLDLKDFSDALAKAFSEPLIKSISRQSILSAFGPQVVERTCADEEPGLPFPSRYPRWDLDFDV